MSAGRQLPQGPVRLTVKLRFGLSFLQAGNQKVERVTLNAFRAGNTAVRPRGELPGNYNSAPDKMRAASGGKKRGRRLADAAPSGM